MGKILRIAVGLPRSGKSTWARWCGDPIVCPDAIRLALHGQRFVEELDPKVWEMAYIMARALFLAGHDEVTVDATNTTKKRRLPWIEKFKDIAEIRCNWIDTPKDECLKRAVETDRMDLIPVIEKMSAQFETPTVEEGFSLVAIGE